MRSDIESDTVARIVMQTLSADFDNVKIKTVQVLTDTDRDGDEILRIEVVFDGTPKDIKAEKLSAAVRHVRPKLFEIGEKAFPLFSFVSSRDKALSLAGA